MLCTKNDGINAHAILRCLDIAPTAISVPNGKMYRVKMTHLRHATYQSITLGSIHSLEHKYGVQPQQPVLRDGMRHPWSLQVVALLKSFVAR